MVGLQSWQHISNLFAMLWANKQTEMKQYAVSADWWYQDGHTYFCVGHFYEETLKHDLQHNQFILFYNFNFFQRDSNKD